jgi:hypothetical protein
MTAGVGGGTVGISEECLTSVRPIRVAGETSDFRLPALEAGSVPGPALIVETAMRDACMTDLVLTGLETMEEGDQRVVAPGAAFRRGEAPNWRARWSSTPL